MRYPRTFVVAVIAVFPDQYDLHADLESGSAKVGEFLQACLTSGRILSLPPARLTDPDSMDELDRRTDRRLEIQRLLVEWRCICRKEQEE